MAKNPCAKTRPASDPYEVWRTPDGAWTWRVLKKWQVDDDKPHARWFCQVTSPICTESGDVYVAEIKRYARKVA